MKELSSSNFGLLIAYLVPGLTALIGGSHLSPTIKAWLITAPPDAPTVGGFLYLTVGSVAAGLTVSTVRWAAIDTFHHATGLHPPQLDFGRLQEHLGAYQVFVDQKYRYYQFYSNSLVALAFLAIIRHLSEPSLALGVDDLAMLALMVIFFAESRQTLREYYERLSASLGARRRATRTSVRNPTNP